MCQSHANRIRSHSYHVNARLCQQFTKKLEGELNHHQILAQRNNIHKDYNIKFQVQTSLLFCVPQINGIITTTYCFMER